jgi:hypothetical protein
METLEKRLATEKRDGKNGLGQAGPFTLRIAGDVGDVEAALALERSAFASPGRGGHRRFAGGIDEPSAAPLCDFLLACDRSGKAAGVCRVLPHAPRDFSRFAPDAKQVYAPIFTALRYAGLGILEAGALTVDPEVPRLGGGEAVCRALWEGLRRYMDSHAMAFALGRETARPAGSGAEEQAARLWEEYGLFAEARTRKFEGLSHKARLSAPALPWLPAGLREALRRGARLAGEPAPRLGGDYEFLWVAARNALE